MSLLKGRKSAAPGARAKASSSSSDFPFAAPAPATAAHELWIEKYSPRTSQELAMHPKKIDEVQQWLQKADVSLQLGLPPTPRLLILSGPPGTGKSAMLRVLGAEHHYETCEWLEARADRRDEQPSSAADGGGRSELHPRAAAFATFLRDSLRTLSLCVQPVQPPAASGGSSAAPAPPTGGRRRLVILDDLAAAGQPGSLDGARDLREQQISLLQRALSCAPSF